MTKTKQTPIKLITSATVATAAKVATISVEAVASALRKLHGIKGGSDVAIGNLVARLLPLSDHDTQTLDALNADMSGIRGLVKEADPNATAKALSEASGLAASTFTRQRIRALLAAGQVAREDGTPITEQTPISQVAEMWRDGRVKAGIAKKRSPKLTGGTEGATDVDTDHVAAIVATEDVDAKFTAIKAVIDSMADVSHGRVNDSVRSAIANLLNFRQAANKAPASQLDAILGPLSTLQRDLGKARGLRAAKK